MKITLKVQFSRKVGNRLFLVLTLNSGFKSILKQILKAILVITLLSNLSEEEAILLKNITVTEVNRAYLILFYG
jgi:hypothetical protein